MSFKLRSLLRLSFNNFLYEKKKNGKRPLRIKLRLGFNVPFFSIFSIEIESDSPNNWNLCICLSSQYLLFTIKYMILKVENVEKMKKIQRNKINKISYLSSNVHL